MNTTIPNTIPPTTIPKPPPFDPTQPLDYKKLGGEIPFETPTQYSWLTTLILRAYNGTSLSKFIEFLYKHLSRLYTTLITTLIHTPVRWLGQIQQSLTAIPINHIIPTLKPILFRIFTFPQYFAYNYPSTTTLLFAAALGYLILFDSETDIRHTPFFPINDRNTPLGAAIATGRKVRRALGGRTFTQYQADKLQLGEHTPTKQQFVDHYGPFVDEHEWNQHHQYRDTTQHHVIYSATRGLTQQDLEDEIRFLRHKQRLALLDERFRQEELVAERRIAVKDQIYNQTQWDLRDGSIILPGTEAEVESIHKPWSEPLPNPLNPIPHLPGHGSLGNTTPLPSVQPYWDPTNDDTRLENTGEFTHELTDLYTNTFVPRLDVSKLRPHSDLNVQEDPWDALGQTIMRTASGRYSFENQDEKALAQLTVEDKKHLLGAFDGEGRYDAASDYQRKQRALLQKRMADHHKQVGAKRSGIRTDQYALGFDPDDGNFQEDSFDFD